MEKIKKYDHMQLNFFDSIGITEEEYKSFLVPVQNILGTLDQMDYSMSVENLERLINESPKNKRCIAVYFVLIVLGMRKNMMNKIQNGEVISSNENPDNPDFPLC